MSSEIAWLVLIASVLTYVRCLLDAFAKSSESLRAHKEDEDAVRAVEAAVSPPTTTTRTIAILPSSKLAKSPKHTRKDLLEFISAMLGISVALLGCMVAAYNLNGIAYAVPLAWGGTVVLGLGMAAWASFLFARYPDTARVSHQSQGPNDG